MENRGGASAIRPEGANSSAGRLYTSPQVVVGRVWHADESKWPEIRVALAGEASIHNDQHLVNYMRDPGHGVIRPGVHAALPRGGSASAVPLWIAECPRETLRDRFLAGRSAQ